MENPTYDYGKGPINIKVVDPLNLGQDILNASLISTQHPSGNSADTASWTIYRYENKGDLNPIDSMKSETAISKDNEQIIPAWGISVQIYQEKYFFPADQIAINTRQQI
jgi:hypothetical protein